MIFLRKCLDLLVRVLQSSLLWMRMMAVEVRSELSVCQWFLWLQVLVLHYLHYLNPDQHLYPQEKTLFGFAALLMNNNPGIVFDAWDLVDKLTSLIQMQGCHQVSVITDKTR